MRCVKCFCNAIDRTKKKGLSGILPYARDNDVDYNAGDDLLASTKWARLLRESAPEFFQYLMEYPNSRPDNVEESFTWVTFLVDGKLNIELLHRMGQQQEKSGRYVFSERQYYVLNNYNCVQALGGAIPLENKRTLVLMSSRVSTDAITGFGSSAKRAIGVRMMGNMMSSILNRYREEEGQGNSEL